MPGSKDAHVSRVAAAFPPNNTSPPAPSSSVGAKEAPGSPEQVTLATPTGNANLPPSDVETTNWNAVKMLASKYGITLKSAAEVQSSAAARVQQAEDGEAQAGESVDSDDLGVGTPFEITATKLEGGRFIYRFKWRGHAAISGSTEADHYGADLRQGRPSAEDEGTSSSFSMPRSVSSGAVIIGKPFGREEPGLLGQNRFRKSGNLMLKSSRSIPVLRGKSGPTYSRLPHGSDAVMGGHPVGNLFLPNRVHPIHERHDGEPAPGPSAWRGMHPSIQASAPSSMVGGSVAMARAESTPVKGPHATRNWIGRLEEGDVLGAILGLRHESVWTTVNPSDDSAAQPIHAQRSPESGKSTTSGSSPVHGSLRERGHVPPSDSVFASVPATVRPFGTDVLLQSDLSSLRTNLDRGGSVASRKRDAAEPLDLTLPPIEHTLPGLDLGAKFAKSPRLHQLREAPSFASTASDNTARGDSHDSDLAAVAAVADPSEAQNRAIQEQEAERTASIVLFDVLQDYVRPWANPNGESAIATRSSRADSISSHRRFNSADLLTSHAPLGNGDAQKHFITEAQSLPTSAAPGDDPRFALWAVRSEKGDGAFIVAGRDGSTLSRHSIRLDSPVRGPASEDGRRQSARITSGPSRLLEERVARNPSKTNAHRQRSSQHGSDLFATGKAVLLAASAARLVAEITSEIDQCLLTDFFYTYREYLAPTELLRLLTLRFDWALAEPTSAQDEARRRIVRVRSYVAIKYWLLHHFEFDFLPNRELRQALASWLNDVVKDERMQSRPADLGIIKSLRKIVRGLKATYSRNGVGGLLYNDAGRVDTAADAGSGVEAGHGVDADLEKAAVEPEDGGQEFSCPATAADDVDLTFDAEDADDAEGATAASSMQASSGGPSQHGACGGAVQAARAAALKAAAESVVLAPHRQVGARLKPAAVAASPNLVLHAPHPPPLPHAHNTLSRVFVHTVGRLSRFKRVLGSRSTLLPTSSFADSSHEDLEFEANDSGDLLFVRGGLENFIQYFNIDSNVSIASGPSPSSDKDGGVDEEADEDRGGRTSDGTAMETPSLSATSVDHSTPASSIDLTPCSIQDASSGAANAKEELGLGIQDVSPDLSSDVEDHGESARPWIEPLGLELSGLGSLSPSHHLHRGPENLHHTTSDQTLRSFSRTEEPAAQGNGEHSTRRAPSVASSRKMAQSIRCSLRSRASGPRIVQIDDIDLSSDEDDGAVRRALRRLPGARDLRMANNVRDLEPVRPSFDSMASSFAHVRTVDVLSVHRGRSVSGDRFSLGDRTQPAFGIVHSEMLDPDEALQGYELVKGFQLDASDSDDDEPGDVEAALRRLEGIIDEDKQREKAKKVEALWQKSLARNAESDHASSPSVSGGELGDDEAARSFIVVKLERSSYSSAASLADNEEEAADAVADAASTDDEPREELADPSDASHESSGDSGPVAPRVRREFASSSLHYDEQRSPAPSLRAIPIEASNNATRARFSMSQIPPGSTVPPSATGAPAHPSALAGLRSGRRKTAQHLLAARSTIPNRLTAGLHPPPVHRSFLLAYRSEVIARQMCLIEAELLQAVSWDELAGSRWKQRRYKCEVTDWESFYRERVRDRLEAQKDNRVHRECAVEAIVARFNLTSNWVASEVVLTQNLDERVAVISKLIRIAWKCYLQCNYASLAQIIFGLSTPWVERLRRTWARVGYYEMRIWRDLNSFVGPKNNFRHLRNAMKAMAVDAGIEDLLSSAGSASFSGVAATGGAIAKRGCIPFFGLFLSDLMINDLLPSHLDPSSPNSTVSMDADSGRLHELADPHAFDHLAPLPPGVELEPLVNIYKYRVVASTIKNVLAFQERSKAYQFEADAGVYVKCLKIRCLQGEQLAKVSHAAEP
ncbi:Guanine nucleotide exchange factor lte1 [Thecaphora frezii]|nr:putative ras gef [Thecaphora frezii]